MSNVIACWVFIGSRIEHGVVGPDRGSGEHRVLLGRKDDVLLFARSIQSLMEVTLYIFLSCSKFVPLSSDTPSRPILPSLTIHELSQLIIKSALLKKFTRLS